MPTVVAPKHDDRFLANAERRDPLDETTDLCIRITDACGIVPTNFVGEIAILCDVPRTATVTATGDLSTLKITKELFFRLVRDFPEIGIEVMRVLAHRLDATNAQLRAAR